MAGAETGGVARIAAALALASALLQGCAPASSMAAEPVSQAEAGLVAESGGLYPDRALAGYVRRVGMALVKAAGKRGAGWQFLVLDTPEANAFALPGGRIYITRGMLALADDEAELATVLAHEIGHAVSGDPERQVGDSARRAAEFHADRLGMSYLEAAGYDPHAQPDFLWILLANHRLAVRLAGGDPASGASSGSGHPALADRLTVAEREAAELPSRGRRARAAYLAAIDGLVWGDGPAQGFVSGGTFVQPELGFAFDAPLGFALSNGPDAVVANGPGGAIFLLDSVPDPGGSPEGYLLHDWVPEIAQGITASAISGLRATRVNGLDAAQGRLALTGEQSERVADLTVVRLGGRLYRLTGLHRAGDTAGASALGAAATSFRSLTPAEARRAEPLRLRIHRIAPGEDVLALAEGMPVEAPRATFDLLNGLRPGRSLRLGDLVKVIAE